MATAFIKKFTRYCGGSRSLAWLLTVNVAASALLLIAGFLLKVFGGNPSILYSLTALPSDPISFALHPWTIVTYSLVHFSPLHLIFNMLWLYWFGRMLADFERDSVLLWLYVGSAVASGVLYIAASCIIGYGPGAYLTGASGAVLGVMCACAMRMPNRTINLFLFGEVRLKWVATVCVALTLLGSFGSGVPTQSAHVGGIIFGVGWFLSRRRIPRRASTQRIRAREANPRRVNTATMRAMNREVPDHVRLDQLLDKIRISGYESLTSKEKTELNYISTKLGE